jgi:hypothetical protein
MNIVNKDMSGFPVYFVEFGSELGLISQKHYDRRPIEPAQVDNFVEKNKGLL